MNKKRVKVALEVLDAVKTRYLDIKQFTDNTMETKCQKEKISANELIFLQAQEQTVGSEKNFCINFVLKDIVLS